MKTLLCAFLLLAGCGHAVYIDIPDSDSGITAIGTEWSYHREGRHYLAYAEEFDGLLVILDQLRCDDPRRVCITTGIGGNTYCIDIRRAVS